MLICGFYIEWSHEGILSADTQLEAIKVFTSQIERASKKNKSMIIQGDVDLCSNIWLNTGYKLCSMADKLMGALAQSGLGIVDVAINTYMLPYASFG